MANTIEQLSEKAKLNAFRGFILFAEDMDHDATHTMDEFLETSKANTWLYKQDGTFSN